MSSPALNEYYLNNFASNVARQICAATFSEIEKVSGSEIKKLTSVRQVNYFVIKYLFQNWKKEMKKITASPYFNYDHPEVKEALIAFKNKVSNHILIAEDDLEPLVKASVKDTLMLMYSPYDYFITEFKQSAPLNLKTLEEKGKYLTINKKLWDSLIESLKNSTEEEFTADYLESEFNRVCEESGHEPDSIDHIIEDLGEYQPIEEDKLYSESRGDYNADPIHEEKVVDSEISLKTTDETISENVEEGESEKPKPIVDKFQSDYETLNDKVASERGKVKTLADQNLNSIKKGLSLNQRYMFTRELFGGDPQMFDQAIEKLDSCSEYNEVISLIEKEFAPNNHWNMDSYEVSEFMHMVNRRFPD
ncbi:hypothetical protein OO013_11670 [Mangrovivirga sp. M17]|uniref:Uncharacterized protein n=1 Tax=Mangrovivirga halotolerans TaxID=2993936 RepID=A0ABT3RRW2_9BACT|nr:hypothetical protein [Mangrovivirga halotolerans]MCX2744529.1 hypothetical protein [Mangrovivirga halotolerans]